MSYLVKTYLHMELWETGSDHEIEAIFRYRVLPGCQGSDAGPAEPASVEIDKMVLRKGGIDFLPPKWMEEMLCDDANLIQFLLDDAAETDIAAREDAAEARAEMRREEPF